MTNKNHKKDGAIKHNTPDFTRKYGVQLPILTKIWNKKIPQLLAIPIAAIVKNHSHCFIVSQIITNFAKNLKHNGT